MKRPVQVRVQKVQYRRGRGRRWYVRWSVNGIERGPATFDTEDEAEDYRARIRIAMRDGEKWDLHSGLPAAWSPLIAVDVATFCRLYWVRRASLLKPRSQAAWGETLSRFVSSCMPPRAPHMPGTHAELAKWIANAEVSNQMTDWLTRWSPQISSLDRRALERVRTRLLVGVKGEQLGAATLHRRFTHASAVIDYAVEVGALDKNELDKPGPEVIAARTPERNMKFPSLAVMFKVIAAVESRRPESRLYRAATAVGILAGLRPSEIMALEVGDLELSPGQWGEIRVERAVVGLLGWSEEADQIGNPKVRVAKRIVPMIPQLADELIAWIEFAQINSGPLFRTRGDKVPAQSNWKRALSRATSSVGTRALTPYDLRRFHGTWLHESGVKHNEAARRMGHSLPTYLRYYVGVTDDVSEDGNGALNRALRKGTACES